MSETPSNPDLLSLVLQVRPLHKTQNDAQRPLPDWWGRAVHTLLLEVVHKHDPGLASELHDSDSGPRPFSASTLMGPATRTCLDPGQIYTIRLSAIQAPLVNTLLQASQPGGLLAPGAQFELDYLPFQVEAAIHQADQHPWAACSTYQELSAEYLLAQHTPPRQLTLQLTSPTTFKSGGLHVPFPLPGLVFNSLLERWNAYAPVVFPPEARRYAEECLAVGRYQLSTRPAPTKGRGLRVGFLGQVTFTSVNYDRYWMSVITVLARYSQYSGLGAGVSMGMGQCRLLSSQQITQREE